MCAHQTRLARGWRSFEFIALSPAASAALAGEQPISPYADPSQLDCPWPKMSHYKQPWRGCLETRGGYEFLSGLGVNLQIPSGTEDLAIRLLAAAFGRPLAGFSVTARSRACRSNHPARTETTPPGTPGL